MKFFYCAACLWFGKQDELRQDQINDELTAECCAACGSEDVFTLRLIRCLVCQFLASQHLFFGGYELENEHPITDLALVPVCPECRSNNCLEVTEALNVTDVGRRTVSRVLRAEQARHVRRYRAGSIDDDSW